MKHMKSLIINTDIGCTVAFSRVGPGKFTCPTCYSACEDINDVLSHLLCEEITESNKFDQFEHFQKSDCNSLHLNENDLESKKDNDSDKNDFDFLLISDSNLNSKNIEIDSRSKYTRNEDFNKPSSIPAESNFIKRKKARVDKHDDEHDKFKNFLDIDEGKIRYFKQFIVYKL